MVILVFHSAPVLHSPKTKLNSGLVRLRNSAKILVLGLQPASSTGFPKVKWGLGNARELETSKKRRMLGTNERFLKYPLKVIASDWVRGRVSSCVSGFEYAP